MEAQNLKVWLAGASGAVVVALGLMFIPPLVTIEWFPRAAVYTALLSLVLLTWAWGTDGPRSQSELKNLWLKERGAIIVSLLLSVWIYLTIGPKVRIIFDEPVLAATGLSIFQFGKAEVIYESYVANNGRFDVIMSLPPTRPVLQPLVTALAHTFTGFRDANIFAASFIGMFLSFWSTIGLGRLLGMVWTGYFAVLCMIATPVLGLVFTSAGMEALNLGLLMLTWFFLAQFWLYPRWQVLECAVFSGILAAQCRYESALILPLVLVAALLKARPLIVTGTPSKLLLIAPFLMVPAVWQRIFGSVANEGSLKQEVFSFDYFPEHFFNLLEFFFVRQKYPVISLPMIWIGVIGGILLLAQRHEAFRRFRAIAVMMIVFVTAVAVVICVHYMGDIREAHQMRLAAPIVGAVAIFAGSAMALVWEKWRGSRFFLVVAAAGLVGICLQGTVSYNLAEPNAGPHEFVGIAKELEKFDRHGTLVISPSPVLQVSQRYGAITFERANEIYLDIKQKFDSKQIREVLVLQYIPQNTPSAESILRGQFQIVPITEFRIATERAIRISRVVSIAQ